MSYSVKRFLRKTLAFSIVLCLTVGTAPTPMHAFNGAEQDGAIAADELEEKIESESIERSSEGREASEGGES